MAQLKPDLAARADLADLAFHARERVAQLKLEFVSLRVGERRTFHARERVAQLKHSISRRQGAGGVAFPRARARGPIEAEMQNYQTFLKTTLSTRESAWPN